MLNIEHSATLYAGKSSFEGGTIHAGTAACH
jgi:hypothetical protein